MTIQTKLSVKGQVVIPKEVRDALHLQPGEMLNVKRVGNQVIMEAAKPPRATISYEEFRRRVPRHEGSPISIEEMKLAVDSMFANKQR